MYSAVNKRFVVNTGGKAFRSLAMNKKSNKLDAPTTKKKYAQD